MIHCTPAAQEFLLKKRDARTVPKGRLRLGVRGGKCAGYSYAVIWDDRPPTEKDLEYAFGDLVIVTDAKSLVFLNDSTLDLEKKNLEWSLKIKNPRQAESCGCGQSFQIKCSK